MDLAATAADWARELFLLLGFIRLASVQLEPVSPGEPPEALVVRDALTTEVVYLLDRGAELELRAALWFLEEGAGLQERIQSRRLRHPGLGQTWTVTVDGRPRPAAGRSEALALWLRVDLPAVPPRVRRVQVRVDLRVPGLSEDLTQRLWGQSPVWAWERSR